MVCKINMILYWSVSVALIVTVCATPRNDSEGSADQEQYENLEMNRIISNADFQPHPGACGEKRCRGPEYQCIDEKCYCAPGFIPNHFQVRCVRCPGLGEKCFGHCCNQLGNGTLTCWQSKCRSCYDSNGNWICREDNVKDILLISSAQVAMGTALVFGIIATFVLLYKLCAATNLRPVGGRMNDGSRLSVGSLQLYIDQRLRDAPPRYSRAPPPGSINSPVSTYLNNGFVHDSSIPPPPYTEEVKIEDQNTALHI